MKTEEQEDIDNELEDDEEEDDEPSEGRTKQTEPLGKRLIWAFVAVIAGILGFVYLNWFVANTDQTGWLQSSKLMFNLAPLFVITMSLFSVVRIIFGYSQDTPEEAEVSDYWVEYGKRLKAAYSSKFAESAFPDVFNPQVDQHVAVMMHNGPGLTRAMAKDWLYRMHRFTEAK